MIVTIFVNVTQKTDIINQYHNVIKDIITLT